jgi:hypothetical protein
MSTEGYFGQHTLYRLLRPLALMELVDRQTNYVDFSVDPAGLVLLRLQAAAYEALTGAEEDFTGLALDWTKEAEHVFKGRLQEAANRLILDDPPRCARFDEFPAILARALEDDPAGGMARLAALVGGLAPGRIPVFWCRLVAYGYVANWLLRVDGAAVGYRPVPYPVGEMLRKWNDPRVSPVAADGMAGRLDKMIEDTPGRTESARFRRWFRRGSERRPG